MPQGFAKKIEINLLFADLALQLGDLPARRRHLVHPVFPGASPGTQALCLAWPADPAHRLRPTFLVLATPLIQAIAVHPDRPRDRRNRLPARDPGNRRALLCLRQISISLRHAVPLYEKLPAFSCLTFGGRYTKRSPRRFPNLMCGPAWLRPMSRGL